MGYNVIFFGEDHDSRVAHEGELALLTGLSGRDAGVVIALEMFERDGPGRVECLSRRSNF